ncbi:molybdopterin-dependent oxidoreductase [Methylibium sp.]|uniref:molybdopterin-dependent oxidoreductase n=1 Tax=Methylibium sp. TaxID=2067992 RepID=UPI00345BF057
MIIRTKLCCNDRLSPGPQTLLAYGLNGAPVPVANGAPLRARQLGYKHAKYLISIEIVASLEGIRGGQGGTLAMSGTQEYDAAAGGTAEIRGEAGPHLHGLSRPRRASAGNGQRPAGSTAGAGE